MVVLAPSSLAGRVTAALRGAGFRGTIVGGAPAGRAAFRRAAGAAAEGVIAPLLAEPGPAWEAFAQAYATRWGEPPDEAAAHGYDAVRLVAAAVASAGLNRALIRDAVRSLSPWPGASGTVSWNALGRNERAVALGSWVDGRLRGAGHSGWPGPRPQRAARRRTASTGPPASRGGRISRPPFASRSFSAVAKSILRCGRRAVPPGSVPRSRSVMTAG